MSLAGGAVRDAASTSGDEVPPVEQVLAQSTGGTAQLDNPPWPSQHCHSVKGTMDQAAFAAQRKHRGLGA